MTLFVSDAHLGRGSREATRSAERDLVAMLRAHEDEVLDGGRLVLLGDVFDQWIEYRHLAPKEGLRLLGLLADWCDRGAEVHYLVGNRDPWHVDLLEDEIGVRLWRGPWQGEREGANTYIAHGDGPGPASRASLLSRLPHLVRHPQLARLYRMCLPGDSGYAFARWVSHRFGTDGTPDPESARRVDGTARGLLRETDAEFVVMGHSHTATLDTTAHGTYLNTGYWFGARTFGRLDEPASGARGPRASLLRWTAAGAETLHATTVDAPTLRAPALL